MKRLLMATAFIALSIGMAQAEQAPGSGPLDPRILYVDYNPDDVVVVHGVYRASTLIKFAEDEMIEHIGLGDTTAWEVAPTGYLLFLKPREERARTNMQVVTRKNGALRAYNFDLYAREGDIEPDSKPTYFQINMRYPADEARRATDLAEMAKANEQLDVKPDQRNRNYWVQGADQLAPVEAYDDGRFTYLRFKPGSEFPAIFTADALGNEAIANAHVEGDTIVIHQVTDKIVLRKGVYATCVFNRNPFGTRIGAESQTQSPFVKRKTLGGEGDE